MKKTLITLFFIALTVSVFGQRKERQERIKALKIAFITDKLELSETEAQKFWPVYNAIEEQKNMLRKEAQKMRKDLNFESLTDEQAKKLIKDMLGLENRKHNLHSKQINDLLKVIPAKKIILLKVVEDQFNKRMFEEMKKRREKFKKNKP
ncbi:MAG: sensor of ECF-type sigma factor [Psychroserpens sp.]|uniref:sensor of ECF-type sigma factor n=1 Tax=Psychroserpens sp. TaxID=2020870 RepID=UPI003001AD97